MINALVATIPSPSSGSMGIGPLRLNAYGLMIALGVIAAVRITGRRASARGIATTDDIAAVGMWGVPAGIIGARLYHVITSLDSFRGHWVETLYVWHGGLGIWGGITLGVIAGVWKARRLGIDVTTAVDCAAPGIAVAQAIGRWGNWWNQELFGRPTTLPWALSVSDSTAREAGYLPGTTFHPTFLYESLACLALAWLLVRAEKTKGHRAGRTFILYVCGYTTFRFFIEGLRIDPAHHVGGMRLNQWVSLAVFTAAVTALLVSRRRAAGAPQASTVSDHE